MSTASFLSENLGPIPGSRFTPHPASFTPQPANGSVKEDDLKTKSKRVYGEGYGYSGEISTGAMPKAYKSLGGPI